MNQKKLSRANEQAASVAADIINRIKNKYDKAEAAHPLEKEPKAQRKAKDVKSKSKPAKVAAPKVAAPKPERKPKEMPFCACGCGVQTKGGTYLPGHDSKHRSAMAGPKVLPMCGCGCGVQTKGGRFLPGHDAKHYSALRKAEKAAADKAKAQAKAMAA